MERQSAKMNIIVRVLHLVIAIVLLSPLVDIVLPNCGMQSGDIKNQLLFNIPKVLFGGMPPPLEAENWFFYSVSVAVGSCYLLCGATGDEVLARYLCFARTVVGIMNLSIAHMSHRSNYIFAVIEFVSAFAVWKTLPVRGAMHHKRN